MAALTYPGRQQLNTPSSPGNRFEPALSHLSHLLSLDLPFRRSVHPQNARRIRRPTPVDVFRRTLRVERRRAAVEQSPRVVLTRAGPCWENTAAGPPRRRESGIVGIDERGKPNAAKDCDGKCRMGKPAGDGITTTRNAAHDVRLGQHPTDRGAPVPEDGRRRSSPYSI